MMQIFFYHSVILESWIKQLAINKGDSDVLMLETSDGMDLMKVEGLEDVAEIKGMSQESLLDPHSWLEFVEAAREAQLIANKLSQIDPENQDHYQNNAKNFEKKAKTLVEIYQGKFDKC